jgi:hypothetical protein
LWHPVLELGKGILILSSVQPLLLALALDCTIVYTLAALYSLLHSSELCDYQVI